MKQKAMYRFDRVYTRLYSANVWYAAVTRPPSNPLSPHHNLILCFGPLSVTDNNFIIALGHSLPLVAFQNRNKLLSKMMSQAGAGGSRFDFPKRMEVGELQVLRSMRRLEEKKKRFSQSPTAFFSSATGQDCRQNKNPHKMELSVLFFSSAFS